MRRKDETETKVPDGRSAETTEQFRMIGRSLPPDFLDITLEWRRLFAEMWGTFLLVLVAAGGGMVSARPGSGLSSSLSALAPGIIVMVIIYTMGAVSGAHLNPAVTLAFALRRNFPWRRVPGYLIAQMSGGIASVLCLRAILGTMGHLGATVPGPDIGISKAVAMEVLLTAGLVNVILGTASGARNIGTNGAIAVGGYIGIAGILGASVSGGSMNPVRSLCPDLIRGNLSSSWIYIIGPLVGAAIGVGFEWILKGKPTAAGRIAAQGSSEFDKEAP